MNTEKLITVVVPVRNRATLLLRTLDSIASQSYRPLHLIIVDNGSTDDTAEKAAEWIRSHNADGLEAELLECEEPGAPQARNRGLEHTATPWVMFFDSDDEMRPDHISKIAREIDSHPDCELIYFDSTVIDEDGWSHPQVSHDRNVMRAHLFHGTLSTQRMAVRTSLMKSVGGWNPECAIWNDLELGVRLLLAAKDVRKLHGDPMVVIHPTGDESITGSCYADREGLFEHTLDIIENLLTQPEHSMMRMWTECRRMIVSAIYAREGATAAAKELRDSVLSRHKGTDRAKLRMVYATQRLLGRGASALSVNLFRAK